jgi:Tol biopolymer transport system component
VRTVALLVAVFGALAGSSLAAAPIVEPSGRIAFSDRVWTKDNDVWEILVFTLPDGPERQLTHGLGDVFRPDWSPDGRSIAL